MPSLSKDAVVFVDIVPFDFENTEKHVTPKIHGNNSIDDCFIEVLWNKRISISTINGFIQLHLREITKQRRPVKKVPVYFHEV